MQARTCSAPLQLLERFHLLCRRVLPAPRPPPPFLTVWACRPARRLRFPPSPPAPARTRPPAARQQPPPPRRFHCPPPAQPAVPAGWQWRRGAGSDSKGASGPTAAAPGLVDSPALRASPLSRRTHLAPGPLVRARRLRSDLQSVPARQRRRPRHAPRDLWTAIRGAAASGTRDGARRAIQARVALPYAHSSGWQAPRAPIPDTTAGRPPAQGHMPRGTAAQLG
jgi:hypothetical protein